MSTGVSKKLVTAAATIAGITALAQDAPDKLYFAALIVLVFLIHATAQTILDWRRKP